MPALGIRNIHVHKGPTTHPLDYDAYDVRDVCVVATDFPELNSIIDHCGMPLTDDFVSAGQQPNVYGGLALVASYIHARPKYFASMMSDLLFYVGPDRLLSARTTPSPARNGSSRNSWSSSSTTRRRGKPERS